MVSFISTLLKNNGQKRLLNELERFVLTSAIYLHDIGIQIFDENKLTDFAISSGFAIPDFTQNNEKETFIRNNHHFLSAYWIRKNIEKNIDFANAYVGDSLLGEIIEKVVISHGINFNYDPKYQENPAYKGETIRLKLLCVLLCLADVLDCDCRRIAPEKLTYIGLSIESILHWYKHYYVSSIQIVGQLVKIEFRFPSTITVYEKNVYREYFEYNCTYWINQIKKEYKEVFNDVGIFYDIEVYENNYNYMLRTLSENEFRKIEDDLVDIVKSRVNSISLKEVVIGILKHDNHVLMVKRRIPEGTPVVLTWQFPAGIIKSGFTEQETIKNEILEETGIVCEPIRSLGRRKHPNTNVICYYWIVKYKSGEIINGDTLENQEVKWVSLNEYHDLVSSDLFQPIKTYLIKEN